MMYQVLTLLCTLLLTVASSLAGVIIDDFSAHPGNTTATFSAPNLGKNPVFLRQTGLETAHVLGGARSASVQAASSIPVTFTFDAEKKIGNLALGKLAAGRATISYLGGSMGEARDLDADFTVGGADAIAATFAKAPSAGALLVTVYSETKFQTFSQPIRDRTPVLFPFSAFPDIDFRHVDGVTFEIQTGPASKKELTYEISRFETVSTKRR